MIWANEWNTKQSKNVLEDESVPAPLILAQAPSFDWNVDIAAFANLQGHCVESWPIFKSKSDGMRDANIIITLGDANGPMNRRAESQRFIYDVGEILQSIEGWPTRLSGTIRANTIICYCWRLSFADGTTRLWRRFWQISIVRMFQLLPQTILDIWIDSKEMKAPGKSYCDRVWPSQQKCWAMIQNLSVS